jgi:hypothetical protein
VRDRIQLTRQTAYDEIQKILAMLPDEAAKQLVLFALLVDRCRKCLAYDPTGLFGCCPDK